jgi:hypothetical protein
MTDAPEAYFDAHGTTEHFVPRVGKRQAGTPFAVTEFAAMRSLNTKSWVVRHWLAVGETSVWFGEPGSGKSVLAEDIGLHVAAGRPWHGHDVAQGAVLYVALERHAVVARRALAFGMHHAVIDDALPFATVRGPIDFREPETALRVVATVEDLAMRYSCKPALIVVDTVSRALCGGDENSPKDMGLLVANMSRIQAGTRVHLMLTHHQPADGKERMRGHGALVGAVDLTAHVGKAAAGRFAEVVKSSDLEEGRRIAFTLKSITIGQDEHGEAVTAPVVIEDQAPTAATRRSSPSLTGAAKVALNALREAIGELGAVPPASNYIPPATRTVTMEQWRDFAYRRGISASDEPRARQAAFQRAVQSLRAANAVGIWEPHAWTV